MMNYLVYPSAVIPISSGIPQQTECTCEIPSLVLPTNQHVSSADETSLHWVKIPQEHVLSQESYASAVRMMSVEQTANWIKTLSVGFGWYEAEYYANEFQFHQITGCFLQWLTDDQLKQLSIRNSYHRAMILWNIRRVFSPPSMFLPGASYNTQCLEVSKSVPSISYMELHSEGSNSEVMLSTCQSPLAQMQWSVGTSTHIGLASHASSGSLSSMELSQSEGSQDIKDEHVATSLRSRSLLLKSILANDKHPEQEQIKNVFKMHGFQLEKITSGEKAEEFIVTFKSIAKAQKALDQATVIGYDLKPKWPQRPKPTCPLAFIVLSKKLTVRARRQLDSQSLLRCLRMILYMLTK